MASKHKLTFAVVGSGGPSSANVSAGWTVSFYLNSVDETADLATGKATKMQGILRGMMSRFYSIPYVRIQAVSDTGAPTRATRVYAFGTGSRFGLIYPNESTGANPPSDSFDALNIRLQTVAGPHRSFLFRGAPDDICEGGGAYVATGPFSVGFSMFRALFLQNSDNWAMRAQQSGLPWSILEVDVATPQKAVAPKLTVLTSALLLTSGSTVRISPSQANPGLGGVWTVNSAIAGTLPGTVECTLKPKRGKKVSVAEGAYVMPTLSVLTYQLLNLADAQPMYGTHKLTGRPFGLQRGRRKAKV